MAETADLPVLGAALCFERIDPLLGWLRDSDRDIELQDFVEPAVLDGEWRDRVGRYGALLDGHGGRIGIHGPFIGLDIAAGDPDVQAIVRKRLLQGLEICEALGATQMVVHSPFNAWHDHNFAHFEWLKDRLFDACHATLAPVVSRAGEIGCELVIENIMDVDPLERVHLANSFDSDAVRVSLDTGHAHLTRHMNGAPPVDYYVKAAGTLLHHVHLQDTDGHADRHWFPGDGTVPWPAVFEALAGHTANPRLIIEVFPERSPGLPACAKALEAQGLAR